MPPKKAFDDEKIPLKAKIGGLPSVANAITEVKFVVTRSKDGTDTTESPITAAASGSPPNRVATHEYTLPAVDDTIDSYTLRYKAEITPPGKSPVSAAGEDEFQVWPAKVEVNFTSDDGEAHKNVKFKIVRGGITQGGPRVADDSGKWGEKVGAGAWQVRVDPPWELEPGATHKGKVRTYKVKKNKYTVEFVAPVVSKPDETTKQYVNLDVDPNGWSESKPFGRVVQFKIGALGDRARAPAARLGKQDDLVYIEVNFTPSTKRNLPKPQLLATGLDGAPAASNSDKTWKGKAKLDADGLATFEVDLGFAGGDVCEVKIGANDTCADKKLTFETWRRVFYEVMYPDFMVAELADVGGGKHDFPATISAPVKARLAAVFIEYVRSASHKYTKAQAPAGTVVKADFLDMTGRDRVLLGGGLPKSDPVAFNAVDARTIQVKFADCTVSTTQTDTPESQEADAPEVEFIKANRYFVPMDVTVAGKVWTAKIDNPAAYHAAPTIEFSTADGSLWASGSQIVIVVEETQQQKKLELKFTRENSVMPTALTATERSKIDPFITSLLDTNALRRFENKIKLKLHRAARSPEDTTRENAVRTELQDRFDALKTPIYYHPGLNDDGTVKSGPVDAAWFEAVKCDKLKIKLPKSAPGATLLPGDFAGPLSSTKCPVKVRFKVKSAGGINGNSGGGRQLFLLSPTRTGGASASTVCHELAHALGMTIMPGRSQAAPGMDPAKHVDQPGGLYYLNSDTAGPGLRNLGKGAHCAYGVTNKTHFTFARGKGSCILFHSGGDADTRPSYCDTCRDHLRARRVTTVTRWATDWAGLAADEY